MKYVKRLWLLLIMSTIGLLGCWWILVHSVWVGNYDNDGWNPFKDL